MDTHGLGSPPLGFSVEKTGKTVGEIVYRNEKGEMQRYSLKVAESEKNNLALLESMCDMLNKHLPDLNPQPGQVVAIKQKGVETVSKSGETKSFHAHETTSFGENLDYFVQQATRDAKSEKEIIAKDLQNIERFESKEDQKLEFYRICASQISYEHWKPGESIGFQGYKVDEVIRNRNGLKIVVLVSTEEGRPPIFCCRGTRGKQNLVDDLQRHIGKHGFRPSAEQIENKIRELNTKYGPVVLTGHSLGGALAQVIAAKCTASTDIQEVCHFNSPGVGQKYVKMFEVAKTSTLSPPVVYSIRHQDDLIYHAGGAHLKADHEIKYRNVTKVSSLQAHQISHIYSDLEIAKRTGGKRISHKVFKVVAEAVRLGPIGQIANFTIQLLPKKPNTKTT